MKTAKKLLREENGQDLIQYGLMVAFVALASGRLFASSSQGVATIWDFGSAVLDSAAGGGSTAVSISANPG